MVSNTPTMLFRLHVKLLRNDTYLASVIDEPLRPHNTNTTHRGYDDTGALYYVIAVVLMYGFSIILMIGSSIKKSKNDNGVRKYMKNRDKIRQVARRQEKFKARQATYGKRYYTIAQTLASSTSTQTGHEPGIDEGKELNADLSKDNSEITQTEKQVATSSSMPSGHPNVGQSYLRVHIPAPDDPIHLSSPGQDMTVTPAFIVPQHGSQNMQAVDENQERITHMHILCVDSPVEV